MPALLFGVAFANIFQGIPIDQKGIFQGNLFTLLNPYGLVGGVLIPLLLVAMTGVAPISLYMLVPALPRLAVTFGRDISIAQMTVSLYMVGIACSQLIMGPLSDRFGRRPVLLAGLSLMVAASIGCSLAHTLPQLIAARFLQALGGASGMVISRAIIRDLYPRERIGAMISLVVAVMMIAQMLSPLTGGLIETAFGWRAIFYAITAGSLAVATAIALALPETRRDRAEGSGFRGDFAPDGWTAGVPMTKPELIRAVKELGLKSVSAVFRSLADGKEHAPSKPGLASLLRVVWGAEYQEQNALLLKPEHAPLFEGLCGREKVPVAFIGQVTGDGFIVLHDASDGSTPVNLELSKVLGDMPQKIFKLDRKQTALRPLALPKDLTVRKALDKVLRLLSVGSKRFLTNKVDRSVTGLVASHAGRS